MPQEPEPDPGYALPSPPAYHELVDSHSSVLDATTDPTYDIETDKAKLRDLASLTKHAIMEAIQCLECNQSESSTDTEDSNEGSNTNSTNFESKFLLNGTVTYVTSPSLSSSLWAYLGLLEPDPGPVSRSTESSSELSTPIIQEISPLITQPPKQTARMVPSDGLTNYKVTPTTTEK